MSMIIPSIDVIVHAGDEVVDLTGVSMPQAQARDEDWV